MGRKVRFQRVRIGGMGALLRGRAGTEGWRRDASGATLAPSSPAWGSGLPHPTRKSTAGRRCVTPFNARATAVESPRCL